VLKLRALNRQKKIAGARIGILKRKPSIVPISMAVSASNVMAKINCMRIFSEIPIGAESLSLECE
jgi:hypothetical protein